MRRISLALALVGAIAATGCGAGAKKSSSGTAPGVGQGTFKVFIQNGLGIDAEGHSVIVNPSLAMKDGKVVSTEPAGLGIDCGEGGSDACIVNVPLGTTVTLKAEPADGKVLLGWGGDCSGWNPTCTLTGPSDKYVVALFGAESDRTGHPNWSDPSLHGPQYRADNADPRPDTALDCESCHGGSLAGVGIAPSCFTCHNPIPNTPEFATGSHFDAESEAWGDHGGWSASCTRCHTSGGFQDYVGVDGTPNYGDGTFKPTNTNTATTAACKESGTCVPTAPNYDGVVRFEYGPLECATCHNAVTDPASGILRQIMFPSKNVVMTDAVTALCGQCHGARESSASVNAKIGETAADAKIATGNSFLNPHYAGAAATYFGADAAGWAEYPNRIYTKRVQHGSCTDCHDPHTGALPADGDEMTASCGKCHFDDAGLPVATRQQLEDSRQFGFQGDIDGDGVEESLKDEIEGLAHTLLEEIDAYSAKLTVDGVTTAKICYDGEGTLGHSYWYTWDATAGACGLKDSEDKPIAYNQFTPRLLRAAFNYQWAHAERGAWAHNPRYTIEILFDSLNDLRQGLGTTLNEIVDLPQRRSFFGHFGGQQHSGSYQYRAFMYSAANVWTQAGFGSKNCYQCHGGAQGITEFFDGNQSVGVPADTTFSMAKVTGIECATCHTYGADMKGIRDVGPTVYFPGQKDPAEQTAIDATAFATKADLLCVTCHTGMEGGLSVKAYLEGADENSWTFAYKGPHYLAGASLIMGTDAKMGYEYPDKTYRQKMRRHADGTGTHTTAAGCTFCHDPVASKHSFEPPVDLTVAAGQCKNCHNNLVNADGTGKKDVVTKLKNELYSAIVAYSKAQVEAETPGAMGVCYKAGHPYWTKNNPPIDETCGPEDTDTILVNPKLVRAIFNWMLVNGDPGAYAHNPRYAQQLMWDSITDLGYVPSIQLRP